MASKTTLNAANLQALGTERLAELLIEISTGSAAAKRRLRLELAGLQGTDDVARAVTQRLSVIERARSKVGWRSVKALKQDLETQRRVIVETIAPADVHEALALMWRFLGLAPSVFARCSDTNGTIAAVFEQAVADLAQLAETARPPADRLAESLYQALLDGGNRAVPLIPGLAPALGAAGLAHLKTLLAETPAPETRSLSERARLERIRQSALLQIADATGDVDGYIALQSAAARQDPHGATQIARRLLTAGRAADALQALERAEGAGRRIMPSLWELAYTETLDAVGRPAEAMAFRWQAFERSLDTAHLRALLKRLPDFDDIEAEEKAMAIALRHRDVHLALDFLVRWPALAIAARLVENRRSEIDGDRYALLTPAAEQLAEKYPLAATLLLRAMIDFTLNKARAGRYGHAGRHLRACAALSQRLGTFGAGGQGGPVGLSSHDEYLAELTVRHDRKRSFWSAFAT